jgi:hypothetical protein
MTDSIRGAVIATTDKPRDPLRSTKESNRHDPSESASHMRDSDLPEDRAMTPDAVVSEILAETKSRAWALRNIPESCRVPVRTRPPLFWESRVRAWWAGLAA